MKRKTNLWPTLLLILVLVAVYFFLSDSPTPQVLTPVTREPTVFGISTSTPLAELSWYRVYFTDPKRPFDKVTTGGIEENLIRLIDASTGTIDAAFYEFDLENVAQALIRAKERGVRIRLVYDDEYTDPDPQIVDFKAAGIPAVPDDRSAYMHNKFLVIDHQCVWTGSFNLTVNAAYKNNENAIVICDPRLVANYEAEFSEMYAGEFGITSPTDTPNPVFSIGTVLIENYFASEDEVMDHVIKTVSLAEHSIRFMAYSFTDDDLSRLMVAKQESGVLIAGIFESRGANNASSECAFLLKNGATITLDGNPYTFHHKVIIIDDEIVIFGSFNFTGNANESNDENLLIVHDPGLAAQFENEFDRRLAESITPVGDSCVTN